MWKWTGIPKDEVYWGRCMDVLEMKKHIENGLKVQLGMRGLNHITMRCTFEEYLDFLEEVDNWEQLDIWIKEHND